MCQEESRRQSALHESARNFEKDACSNFRDFETSKMLKISMIEEQVRRTLENQKFRFGH